jgi:hypothetical protein
MRETKSNQKPSSADEIEIAEWRCDGSSVIRVRLDKYRGRDLIDIRKWWVRDGKYRPTTRGIKVDVRNLPRLVKAMKKALKRARKGGFIKHE